MRIQSDGHGKFTSASDLANYQLDPVRTCTFYLIMSYNYTQSRFKTNIN